MLIMTHLKILILNLKFWKKRNFWIPFSVFSSGSSSSNHMFLVLVHSPGQEGRGHVSQPPPDLQQQQQLVFSFHVAKVISINGNTTRNGSMRPRSSLAASGAVMRLRFCGWGWWDATADLFRFGVMWTFCTRSVHKWTQAARRDFRQQKSTSGSFHSGCARTDSRSHRMDVVGMFQIHSFSPSFQSNFNSYSHIYTPYSHM